MLEGVDRLDLLAEHRLPLSESLPFLIRVPDDIRRRRWSRASLRRNWGSRTSEFQSNFPRTRKGYFQNLGRVGAGQILAVVSTLRGLLLLMWATQGAGCFQGRRWLRAPTLGQRLPLQRGGDSVGGTRRTK